MRSRNCKQLQRQAITLGMTQLNDRTSLLAFLKSRKSASAKAMKDPGPQAAALNEMLVMATRVPDHGKLAPWRFIVFQGDARGQVGQEFAKRWAVLNPGHSGESLSFQAALFARAPTVVAVVSTAAPHAKIPVWEQTMSAGAVCFNLVLAAQALGFDAQWQTDWVAYDVVTKSAMGVEPRENVSGLIYIGTTATALEDRPRPEVADLVTHWGQ